MGKYREPQSANEAALQNLLGEQNELREPQSPVEFYLQELIEQGGGSSLPEVTSEDNGKVLKVEDGEWGKGDVATTFLCTDYDSETGEFTFANTSVEDIYGAYKSGIVRLADNGGILWLASKFGWEVLILTGMISGGYCGFVGASEDIRSQSPRIAHLTDDGNGNVIMTVDPVDVGDVLYTPTASEAQALMSALQGVVTAAVTSMGSLVHTVTIADMSALCAKALECKNNNRTLKVVIQVSTTISYVCTSTVVGEKDGNGTSQIQLAFSNYISGVGTIYANVGMTVFSTQILAIATATT